MSDEWWRACSPWWSCDAEGHFQNLKLNQMPDEAIQVSTAIKKVAPKGISIFIRGSVVESHRPFSRSDLDIIAVAPTRPTVENLSHFCNVSLRTLDLKRFSHAQLKADLNQLALLRHRSIQVCGPDLNISAIKADFDFAWKQWCTYFPIGLPPEIDSQDRWAIIHFKLFARCFGVLSLLYNGCFTRDIDSCIEVSEQFIPKAASLLKNLREDLEQQKAGCWSIQEFIPLLCQLFDCANMEPHSTS